MIEVKKITEKEWGKTYGSCNESGCNNHNVTRIEINLLEIRLCTKHLNELLDKLRRLK